MVMIARDGGRAWPQKHKACQTCHINVLIEAWPEYVKSVSAKPKGKLNKLFHLGV